MKPVIGITPDVEKDPGKNQSRYFLWDIYVTVIEKAGGVPLILPHAGDPENTALLLDRIHGLMLTGGAFDIDPSYYGEEGLAELGTVKQIRTRFEMEITKQALQKDLPILGICGGEQNINVALKGSLYQDILSQNENARNHEQKSMKTETDHSVQVVPGTLLHQAVGAETLRVNSTHHQSVKDLGEGLRVNALAEDGVIEGIESTRHRFVLGVQWHPEYLCDRDTVSRRIFEAFIHAARIPRPA